MTIAKFLIRACAGALTIIVAIIILRELCIICNDSLPLYTLDKDDCQTYKGKYTGDNYYIFDLESSCFNIILIS